MNRKFILFVILPVALSGCATPTNFNISNDSIDKLSDTRAGTYSDYGGDLKYDDREKLHYLKVFVGGLGSCDNGAILYAKPKLDAFMKANNFSSYKIIRGEYSLLPLSKCELYIKFDK